MKKLIILQLSNLKITLFPWQLLILKKEGHTSNVQGALLMH